MLLTYQKESVYPLLAIHLAIHQPLTVIHIYLTLIFFLAIMPSNDY